MLIGEGRSTVLLWDGEAGGRMLWSDGAPRQSFIGMVWDGAGVAAVGIDHDSKSRYETRVMHEHLELRNFELAGIRVGHDQDLASAEMLYTDLRFRNNANGVLIQAWNDYNNVFDGCHFEDNGYGIKAERGNVAVRNSRFERSREADVLLPAHASSARRVVSIGSNRFIETVRGPDVAAPIRVENSWIEAWTSPEAAIVTSLRGPVVVFDTWFAGGAPASAAIRLANPARTTQVLVHSNVVRLDAGPLIEPGPNGIALGVERTRPEPPLVGPGQRFLRGFGAEPGLPVLDVKRDCGAHGNGTADDTGALEECLGRAQAAAARSLVYVPSGDYAVTRTLHTGRGARYALSGTGWHSRLLWQGAANGTLLEVEDPNGLAVQSLTLGGAAGTRTLREIGAAPSSVYYHNVFGYHRAETERTTIEFSGLPRDALVVAQHLDGRVTVEGSANARILVGFSTSVALTLEAAEPGDGWLGILTRVSSQEDFPLEVAGAPRLVVTDWYNEQSPHLGRVRGTAAGPGNIVLDYTRAGNDTAQAFLVTAYDGMLAHVGGQFGLAADSRPREFRVDAQSRARHVFIGNSFWNTEPVLPLDGVTSIGNVVHSHGADGALLMADRPGAESALAVNAVLDEFRSLGAYDLALNYCAGPLLDANR
jgi:hypothetical protein